VAGVAAVIVINNNNNQSGGGDPPEPIKPAELTLLSDKINPVLEVYGNVNMDTTIDNKDVEVLEKAIAAGKTAEYKYADANFDGTVDADDVQYIKDIMAATVDAPVKVKHLCRLTTGDYYNESYVPVDSILMTGSANMFLMAKYIGLGDEIKGIAYNGLIEPILYAEYQELFKDYKSKFDPSEPMVYRIGGSAGYFNKELCANHIVADDARAIFTADNAKQYLSGDSAEYTNCYTEQEAKDAGFDVFRFKAASTDMNEFLSDLALMAFATGKDVSKVADMAVWSSNFIKDLNKRLTDHVGVDTNQKRVAVTSATQYKKATDGTITTYNYISSDKSDYTKVAIAAGGFFALKDFDFKGSSTSPKMTDLGKWLEPFDVETILAIKTAAPSGSTAYSWYGGTAATSGKTTLEQGPLSLSLTEAYYENEIYSICGDMPVLLRIAYAAHILYPEVFSQEWADNYNIEHSKNFLGLSESVVKGGKYYVSMEDLGLDGKVPA
jgi:hypothetical protein